MSPLVAKGEAVVLPDDFLAALHPDLRWELLVAVRRWEQHRSVEGSHHIVVPGREREGVKSIVGNCGFCLIEREPEMAADRLERTRRRVEAT